MRLFVAAWPPASVVEQLAALERPAHEGMRWTTPDQWHVTLRFLGNVASPDPVVSALEGAVGARRAVATMGPESDLGGPGLLWLPVSGLDALAAEVVAATSLIGAPPEDRAFRGHLTLARARGRRGRIPDMPPLQLPASWEVTEVAVVESVLGGQGSRYTTVGRVALG